MTSARLRETTRDVVVAGAGPAGCVAALMLARAGARVLLLDRAKFPRDKLCGDTLNPGALAVLRRLNVNAAEGGLPVDGMIVSGPGGVRVAARYPGGVQGRALTRRDLDAALVQAAADAGVEVDEGVLVQRALVGEPPDKSDATGPVCGVELKTPSGQRRISARLVIAADGRESRIARALSLATHPSRPRSWAVGSYFHGVAGMTSMGEMHVRAGHYLGVAPLPGGLTNACVVSDDRRRLRDGGALLEQVIGEEPELRDRFRSATMIGRPVVLGPLAVDCRVPGAPGVLLAGDAAGFIDPMTGDGLRFALRGAELAAVEGLRALQTGAADAHIRLAAAREREFVGKWRFNRALRQLAGSPAGVRAAGFATRLSSWPISRIIGYAGDVTAA